VSRPVTVTIPHKLGRDEARRRLEEGFGRLRRQMTGGMGALLACHERWEGDRLHFEAGALGQKMTGRVDVSEDSVRIEVDLPAILAALAERVAGKLKDEGRKLLEQR
jgi:hypothetical protein